MNLHNQNRTQTFIDVESGQFISLPKDLTDKPPVNADINNNIDEFHTTGGEGTPSEQIPLVNVSEWNKTVCGKNVYNKQNNAIANGTVTIVDSDNDIVQCTGNYSSSEYAYSSGWYRPNASLSNTTPSFPLNTVITISADVKLITAVNSANMRIYIFSTSKGYGYTPVINKPLTLDKYVRISQTFTITDSYKDLSDWYPIFTLNSNTVEIKNIMIAYGTDYQPYQGNTYPYRLEDTDGILHYGGDLPDGTADTYNRETGEFVEYKRVKVLDGTETWTLGDVETGYTTFTTPLNELARPIEYFIGHSVYYVVGSPPTVDIRPSGLGNDAIIAIVEVDPNTTYFIKKFEPASNRLRIVGLTDYPLLDSEPQVPEQIMGLFDGENEAIVTTESNIKYLVIYVSAEGIEPLMTVSETPLETDSNSLRCSHFPTVLTDNNLIFCDGTTLTLQINTTVLPTQTVQALNTWLGLNNVTVQYKLETPVIYQIKQYGETYGGVVWEYNEKPKSIQYHTNIFTDKNITMQCEVRKLGNRKMSEFYWVTENGDKIITENDDYIMFEY